MVTYNRPMTCKRRRLDSSDDLLENTVPLYRDLQEYLDATHGTIIPYKMRLNIARQVMQSLSSIHRQRKGHEDLNIVPSNFKFTDVRQDRKVYFEMTPPYIETQTVPVSIRPYKTKTYTYRNIMIHYKDSDENLLDGATFVKYLSADKEFRGTVTESLNHAYRVFHRQDVLSKCKNGGYYVKGPLMDEETKGQSFYWVVQIHDYGYDDKGVEDERNVDHREYKEFLYEGQTVAETKRGNTIVLAPWREGMNEKSDEYQARDHIAKFLRFGSNEDVDGFWREVGEEMMYELVDINEPFLPGLGGNRSPWVHFRIDQVTDKTFQTQYRAKGLSPLVTYPNCYNYHRDRRRDFQLVLTDVPDIILDTGERSKSARVGSDRFRAPEVVNEESGHQPGLYSDIFSCATLISLIMADKYLFDQLEVITKVKYKSFRKTHPNLNIQCRHLLHSMLQEDPRKRPTADECLEHPFFETTDYFYAQHKGVRESRRCAKCDDGLVFGEDWLVGRKEEQHAKFATKYSVIAVQRRSVMAKKTYARIVSLTRITMP